MKHIIIYGPGNSFTTLVDDSDAKVLQEKFDKGKAIDIDTGDCQIRVRAGRAWAIKIEDFADRRRQADTQ